jgi:hypothetical protein
LPCCEATPPLAASAGAEVIESLITDATLRAALTDALVAAPFEAFYWEASSVAPGDVEAPFASVVLDAPGLASVPANGAPFLRRAHAAQIDALSVEGLNSIAARKYTPIPRHTCGPILETNVLIL